MFTMITKLIRCFYYSQKWWRFWNDTLTTCSPLVAPLPRSIGQLPSKLSIVPYLIKIWFVPLCVECRKLLITLKPCLWNVGFENNSQRRGFSNFSILDQSSRNEQFLFDYKAIPKIEYKKNEKVQFGSSICGSDLENTLSNSLSQKVKNQPFCHLEYLLLYNRWSKDQSIGV